MGKKDQSGDRGKEVLKERKNTCKHKIKYGFHNIHTIIIIIIH